MLIGELGMVRAARGVSLRYAAHWRATGFPLSEDVPRRLGPLPDLTDVAQIDTLVKKVLAGEPVPAEQRHLIAPGVTMGAAHAPRRCSTSAGRNGC